MRQPLTALHPGCAFSAGDVGGGGSTPKCQLPVRRGSRHDAVASAEGTLKEQRVAVSRSFDAQSRQVAEMETVLIEGTDRELNVDDGTRVVARAAVHVDSEAGLVQASMHVEAGHVPVGVRSDLVDAVLDQPEVVPGTHVQASIPAGDSEMLERLRDRCSEMHSRRAGATALVDASVPAPRDS